MAWHKFTITSEALADLEHFRLLQTVEQLRSRSQTSGDMVLFEDRAYRGPERIYYLFNPPAAGKKLGDLLAQFSAVPCSEPVHRELRLVVGDWGYRSSKRSMAS